MGIYSDIYITFTASDKQALTQRGKEITEKVKSIPNAKAFDMCENAANTPEPRCTSEANLQSQYSSE